MRNLKLFSMAALAGVLVLSGCQQAPSYTVTGTVANPTLEGKKVLLQVGEIAKEARPVIKDSTVIVNGQYQFTGVVEAPECAYVIVNPGNRELFIRTAFALENAKITLTTDTAGVTVVSGTSANDQYQAYLSEKQAPMEICATTRMQLNSMRGAKEISAEVMDSLNNAFQTAYEKMNELQFNFLKGNINNPAAWSELYNASYAYSTEQMKEILAGVDERTANLVCVKEIQERIAIMEKTAVGQPFTDLRMNDPEGKEVALSDYAGKGKYVLVDFWASWCGPCRAEMPTVRAAYRLYKNKGLEIVGVSFDSQKEAWTKAFKELEMTWPQMSDLKGWESEGAKQYAIRGIPHTLLLDKDGTILARGLRGKELLLKLKDLMDK